MDMRSGLWNVRKADSLIAVSRELARYKLYLVAVQVRWECGHTKLAGEYTFLYGKGT
jgi:hypothetical protein